MDLNISNFVKFRFQQMTLKIERVFEKIYNFVRQKLVKRAMNLVTKKSHNKCKISYIRKKFTFFCKIISLCTINNLRVVIEIYASLTVLCRSYLVVHGFAIELKKGGKPEEKYL